MKDNNHMLHAQLVATMSSNQNLNSEIYWIGFSHGARYIHTHMHLERINNQSGAQSEASYYDHMITERYWVEIPRQF